MRIFIFAILIITLIAIIIFARRSRRKQTVREWLVEIGSTIVILPGAVLTLLLCAVVVSAGLTFAGLDGLFKSIVIANYRRQSKRPHTQITSWRQLKRLPAGRKFHLHAVINNTSNILRDGFVYIEWVDYFEDFGIQEPKNNFTKPWKIGIVLDDEAIVFKAPMIRKQRLLDWSFKLQSDNDPETLGTTRLFRGVKPYDYVVLKGQVRLRKPKQPRRVIEEISVVSAQADWIELPLSPQDLQERQQHYKMLKND